MHAKPYVATRALTFILPDLSPKESMQLYKRGLQPRILNEINLKEPINVDEMIQLAERVDALKPGVGYAGPSRPAFQQTTTQTRRFVRRTQPARLNTVQAPGPPAAVAVAAVRPPPRRPPGRGPRPPVRGPAAANVQVPANPNRNWLQREGRCFICERTGQIARDCPQGNGPHR